MIMQPGETQRVKYDCLQGWCHSWAATIQVLADVTEATICAFMHFLCKGQCILIFVDNSFIINYKLLTTCLLSIIGGKGTKIAAGLVIITSYSRNYTQT